MADLGDDRDRDVRSDDDEGALDADDLEGQEEPRVITPETAPLISPD